MSDREHCEWCGILHPPAYHLAVRTGMVEEVPPPAECRPVPPGTFPDTAPRTRRRKRRNR